MQIDNPPLNSDRLLDGGALLEWLKLNAREGEVFTAIIDVSRYDDLPRCIEELAIEASDFAKLPNLYGHFSPEMKSKGPRLFTAALDSPAWQAIADEALQSHSVSFVLAPAPNDQLCQHLKRLIKMQQPDGSQLLFRFQDAVVLSAVMPLISPRQNRALLGPASLWMVPDVCGRPVCAQKLQQLGPALSSFALDQQQLAKLDHALRPGTIIAQANETDSTLLASMSQCRQWHLVRERQRQAVQHGLTLQEDIALYCVLSLQLPAGFDQQGPVADALQRAQRERIGFGEAIDQVPTHEWRAWDEFLDKAAEAAAP